MPSARDAAPPFEWRPEATASIASRSYATAWFGDVFTTAHQWLQFDVGPATLITGVVTKGRGDGHRKHWVTKFRLSYSNDSETWHFYKNAAHLGVNVMCSIVLSCCDRVIVAGKPEMNTVDCFWDLTASIVALIFCIARGTDATMVPELVQLIRLCN